ncbi:MAG: hypothetical protein R3F40_01620 [Candidatus Competibacteraceae bacterium]
MVADGVEGVGAVAAIQRASPAFAFDDGGTVTIALFVLALRQRRLLGGGIREQQHIGHVLAALAGSGLLWQRCPAQSLQHFENDLGFRNRFVGLAIGGKGVEDRADPGTESGQLVAIQTLPSVRLLDAFAQKILGEQLALHGSPPVYPVRLEPIGARVRLPGLEADCELGRRLHIPTRLSVGLVPFPAAETVFLPKFCRGYGRRSPDDLPAPQRSRYSQVCSKPTASVCSRLLCRSLSSMTIF